jgi:CMP/dCMP kinase
MGAFKRERGLVVAIDGPAGAGKSTLARAVARAIGLPYVNTGVMYRAVAEAALRLGIDPGDAPGLESAASRIEFGLDASRPPALVVDGRAPGRELESAAVEDAVSLVSSHPAVRAVLRRAQRALGEPGAVMEGRDIGTVVFPDADVKIFVTASPEVREARRRLQRGDDAVAGAAVERRDALDARTNPLEPAPGAVVIDSTDLQEAEVVRRALEAVRASGSGPIAGGAS